MKIKTCEHIKEYKETENQAFWDGILYCIDCIPNEFFET